MSLFNLCISSVDKYVCVMVGVQESETRPLASSLWNCRVRFHWKYKINEKHDLSISQSAGVMRQLRQPEGKLFFESCSDRRMCVHRIVEITSHLTTGVSQI